MDQHFLRKVSNDTVEFVGFPELEKCAEVTLRIHNDRLIINFGQVLTAMEQSVFVLHDKKTTDEKALRLIEACCPDKNTAFYRPLAEKAEYYQAKDIVLPDD